MDRCGSLWVVVGSLWVVVDRCGSLWVVVGRCGSFRVLVTTFFQSDKAFSICEAFHDSKKPPLAGQIREYKLRH